MKNRAEILHYMKSHPLWDEFQKVLFEARPVLPVYDPKEDNSALWRHKSAQQEGFDILAAQLQLKGE